MDKYFRKALFRVKLSAKDISLPFSVRSTGHYRLAKEDGENRMGENFVQLYWVKRGSGKAVLDGQEYLLAENQVFYYLPGEDRLLIALEKDEPWEYRWFTFDGLAAEAVMAGFRYPRQPFFAGICPEELFEVFEKRIHDASILEMKNLATIAWKILMQAGNGNQPCKRNEQILRNFFDLVRENYSNETVNVNVLAELLDIHRSTLTQIVGEQTGMTPGAYLYDFRLNKALEILRSSIIPVGKVASACGIPNPCYFSRVIRKAVGKSPLAYRKYYNSTKTKL